MVDTPTPDKSSPLPRDLDQVGTSLRRAYDQTATEPLPDAFEELLRQLR